MIARERAQGGWRYFFAALAVSAKSLWSFWRAKYPRAVTTAISPTRFLACGVSFTSSLWNLSPEARLGGTKPRT